LNTYSRLYYRAASTAANGILFMVPTLALSERGH
jgi:hypothetical protein